MCSEVISFSDLLTDTCPPPQLSFNGTETEDGEVRIGRDYHQVREVKFYGSIGPLGERRFCKIKCIGGQWVGPLCVNQQGISAQRGTFGSFRDFTTSTSRDEKTCMAW